MGLEGKGQRASVRVAATGHFLFLHKSHTQGPVSYFLQL